MFGLTPTEEAAILAGPKRLAMALLILRFVAEKGEQGATCDECIVALNLPHQSGSPRYAELVRSGCLVAAKKRATRTGALALAHRAAPDADFRVYLATAQKKGQKATLPAEETAVLAAGMKFVRAWRASSKNRENAAVTLINELGTIARKPG